MKPYTKKTLPDFGDGLLDVYSCKNCKNNVNNYCEIFDDTCDGENEICTEFIKKPIKAKTLKKKLEKSISGDLLGSEFEFKYPKSKKWSNKKMVMYIKNGKSIIKEIEETPEIGKLDLDIPKSSKYKDGSVLYFKNDLPHAKIEKKINEICEWINTHEKQHRIDREDTEI